MRALVRILLGGCGAIVRFVGAGLLWIFFYSGELSTGDLPPAIFVTGTRSPNLPNSVARVSDPCMKRRRSQFFSIQSEITCGARLGRW
jgi:hypothetical protein